MIKTAEQKIELASKLVALGFENLEFLKRRKEIIFLASFPAKKIFSQVVLGNGANEIEALSNSLANAMKFL